MSELGIVIGAVLPVLTLVLVGAGIRRVEWLTAEADASLVRVTVNLLMPCLIFDSILGNQAFRHAGNIIIPPLLGFATTSLGILGGWLARRALRPGGWPPARQRTFAFSVGVCNYGYVPLPLAQALFDRETVGVLLVLNVGVEIAMWTVGLMLLGGRSGRAGWRHLLNPPVLSIVAALLLNFLAGPEHLPGFLLTAAHLLGQCAIPLGIVLIGATMADLMPDLRGRPDWRVSVMACVVRLGVLPLMYLAFARWLPTSVEAQRVLVLHAAMPAAVFPIVMARHYGGDTATALRVVLSTSLAGVVTIPLWIRAGMAWIQ